MKKLLCFVLALAMVASCVSMVTFFVSAAPVTGTNTVDGKYSFAAFDSAAEVGTYITSGATLEYKTKTDLTNAGIPTKNPNGKPIGGAVRFSGSTATWVGATLVPTGKIAAVADEAGWYQLSYWYFVETVTSLGDKRLATVIRTDDSHKTDFDGDGTTEKASTALNFVGVSAVSTEWKYYEVNIKLTADNVEKMAAAGTISTEKGNPGAVYWFDDIKFEKLASDPNAADYSATETVDGDYSFTDLKKATDVGTYVKTGAALEHYSPARLAAAEIPTTLGTGADAKAVGGAIRHSGGEFTYSGAQIVTNTQVAAVVDGAGWYRVSFWYFVDTPAATYADKRICAVVRTDGNNKTDFDVDGDTESNVGLKYVGVSSKSTGWVYYEDNIQFTADNAEKLDAVGTISIDKAVHDGSVYFLTNIKFEKLDYDPTAPTPTPTPVGTPTPAPTSALVDFEDAADINKVGTMGGTLEYMSAVDLAAAGVDATTDTNKTIGGAAKYVGPAPAPQNNRYVGMTVVPTATLKEIVDGASWYRVSFWINIDTLTTLGDKAFGVNLRPGAKADLDNDSTTETTDNQIFGVVTMNTEDQWIFYEADIYVSEETAAIIEANAGYIAIDKYNTGATYYVDDVKFEKLDFDPTAPTPTPTNKPTAAPGGKDPSTGTGDVLPVALIATVAIATIGLVVVAKKKED